MTAIARNDSARACSLVEVPNPTQSTTDLPDSLSDLLLSGPGVVLSSDGWCVDSKGSDGRRHIFEGREIIRRQNWQAPPVPPSENRSRGTLGTVLPANWWARPATCSIRHGAASAWTMAAPGDDPCKDTHCEACRLKRVGRRARDIRAASVPWLLRGARLLLFTTTRAPSSHETYTSLPGDVARFIAANRVFAAHLRAIGALGGATVYEAKLHRERPGLVHCCESERGQHCPMCQTTEGKLPQAHLHGHHIVLVPEGWSCDWGLLHRLEMPRAIDPRWGRVDVSRGSTRRGGDSLGAYLGGYLSRLKESSGCQTAWMRRSLGRSGRTLSSWGVLRGAARSGATVEVLGENDSTVAVEMTRTILVRSVKPRAADVAATARDAARVLRGKGVSVPRLPWKQLAALDYEQFTRPALGQPSSVVIPLRRPRWAQKRRQQEQRPRLTTDD